MSRDRIFLIVAIVLLFSTIIFSIFRIVIAEQSRVNPSTYSYEVKFISDQKGIKQSISGIIPSSKNFQSASIGSYQSQPINITFQVTNNGNSDLTLTDSLFLVKGSTGNTYSPFPSAIGTIRANTTQSITLSYDVRLDDTSLDYQTGLNSKSDIINL